MEKVISHDGTPIAYHRRGSGPPLVLVHGSASANPIAWTAVLPTLEEHFTVYAMDRRGRGESGDGPTYAIEREVEDIVAVVDSIGQPVNLLGHSFGALCVLEAALLTWNLRKLILYEPAIPLPDVVLYPEGVIDRLQALLDSGDREGVLTTLYREVVMIPPHEIEQLKASPAWPARVASAHTVLREAQAEEQYTFDAWRFKDFHTPTLLLLGGDSPQILKAATEIIDRALPDSQIAIMPRQQHTAMYTAPDLFLNEVLTFLIGPG
ncbi:MAG: alpha/beta hydrolase [Anaerolineae bacterium]|nr:alpha/beta hydrolase [Anaerolineae bacterium]